VELASLVHLLRSRDALGCREWLVDAARAGFDWARVPELHGLDAVELAIAAGVVEMMAERDGKMAPPWTARVPPSPQRMFLVKAAESMPRLRRLCEQEGPWPLRRRGILAPPEFLTAA
jgi:hypothetical protein